MGAADYTVAALLAYVVTYFFQGGPEDKKKRDSQAAEVAAAVASGKMITGKSWVSSWSNLGASEMLYSALCFQLFSLLPWQQMPFGAQVNIVIQFIIFSVLGYMAQVFLKAKLDIEGWEWMLGPLVPLGILWAVNSSLPIVSTAYQWAARAFVGVG